MFRRMIFPALMGVAGVSVLVSLGIWQVQRMQWKAGVLAEITNMISAEPVALAAELDPALDKYRPVRIEGRFTGAFVEVLAGQVGTSPGVRVIEAFDAQGRLLLIDRGFLPEDQRGVARPVRDAAVVGNLHWPEETDSFTPPPDPKTGLWFVRDVPAMADRLGTEPVLIVAREPTGDGIVAQPVSTSGIPNDHWGYAITWFALALVWTAMTGYLLVRIARRTV